MAGIVAYGSYIPVSRIQTDLIASQWGKCAEKVERSLKIIEKAVAAKDEDVLTMAYEACVPILQHSAHAVSKIGTVMMGSETFPYAVKPTAAGLAQWLGIGHAHLAFDTQFACKAGTSALIACMGLVRAGDVEYALAVASDKANARPSDALEYSAASGANVWLLGSKDVAVEIEGWFSYTSDTPDFWRRAKASFPSHAGRFTGSPAYFTHIMEASNALLTRHGYTPKDFAYAVFHMPNGSFPLRVAQKLGFERAQVEPSYIVPYVGNSYAASALMGLASVLEHAKPHDRIFFASYGSGAGSDAMIFRCTDLIDSVRCSVSSMLKNKKYIDYPTYTKYMDLL